MLLQFVVLSCFFFFFQAEDGIRDWSVTGVQTCALPIFGHRDFPESVPLVEYAFDYAERNGFRKVTMADKSNVMTYAGSLWQRSEERRVGKECRAWRPRYDSKEKVRAVVTLVRLAETNTE